MAPSSMKSKRNFGSSFSGLKPTSTGVERSNARVFCSRAEDVSNDESVVYVAPELAHRINIISQVLLKERQYLELLVTLRIDNGSSVANGLENINLFVESRLHERVLST